MLWLAVVVPDLPLLAFPGHPSPFAVTEGRRLLACDEAARSHGLSPGMSAAESGVLCPDLCLRHRDAEAEGRALSALASILYRVSPHVCVRSPGVVARFTDQVTPFRDIGHVMSNLREDLREAGITGMMACAPTAEAAMLYATVLPGQILTRQDKWRDHVARLPVTCLPFPQHVGLFKELRLRTLGECMALPRAGLVRRFGAEMGAFFDRLVGARAEIFAPWRPPVVFSRRLHVSYALDSEEALLFALRRPLAHLTQVLRRHDAVADQLTLDLIGEGQTQTQTLCLTTPARRGEVFLTLVRERFRSRNLPFAVTDIHMRCDVTVAREGSLTLWPEGSVRADEWGALVDRLRARLGSSSVCTVRWHADHRPEKATREWPWSLSVPASCSEVAEAHHPLWLIDPPERLGVADGQPRWQGESLRFLEGPERIESGWWDEAVAREYFVVRAVRGQRLWIFRGREDEWFLQGYFA
ncbi:MAG: DNA polymerase Y family protein [Gammaproteobacteria bacterium]|nr:DNA polymerase Y family protein [Gammaproteobacteria bacterium]